MLRLPDVSVTSKKAYLQSQVFVQDHISESTHAALRSTLLLKAVCRVYGLVFRVDGPGYQTHASVLLFKHCGMPSLRF